MGVTKKIAMLQAILLATVLAIALLASGAPGRDPSRKIPCKTAEIAAMCYWTHGRLGTYNGNPTYRIWKIGTHRILGVRSGPSAMRDANDSMNPEFPANVDQAYKEPFDWIFADFEVCPLEPEHAGWMQHVCIESAKNIFVKHVKD